MAWFAWTKRPDIAGRQLEAWLSRVLIPVEPSSGFIGRLRARLVTYQGRKFPTGWLVVAVAVSLLLVIASVVGQVVRVLVVILAILAAVGRQRQERRREASPGEMEAGPS